MMSGCGGLSDLVPEVLNVAVPELADYGLVSSARCACGDPEALHVVEDAHVLIARQGGRRSWAEFIGTRQREKGHSGPLSEICRREIGRSQLVVSGSSPSFERRRGDIRSVLSARCHDFRGDGSADRDATGFFRPVCNLSKILLELGIEHRLKIGIESEQ